MLTEDIIAEDRAIDKARCRRCGGTGQTEWHAEAGSCVWCYEYHAGPCATPCIRCAGVGTEPMSVAEIISAGIRVRRGDG